MGNAAADRMNRALVRRADWMREFGFLWRDKTALVALAVLLVLSAIASSMGVLRVSAQESDIGRMLVADATDREAVQAPLGDFGDAAYYSFYISYDAPAPLAFAAMGQRDTAPYLKRIRLLALEGQIYSGESPNPLLAQIGSLDLSFIAAYVLPLILIVLLYDLKASEQLAGRLMFLEAMPYAWRGLWMPRIVWRACLVFAAIALPFVFGALARGAGAREMLFALAGIAVVTVFWAAVSSLMAMRPWSAAAIGAALVGLWLALNVLVPTTVQSVVIPTVDGPDGADIALVQREAVNDAWDLPKSATLEPFAELFPEYTIEQPLKSFDWRWYFAFQHMGDVAARDLSEAYREAIRQRDKVAGITAWVSPALAIQRHLQRLGRTDVTAQLAYDAAIRSYHSELQAFYLPLMFGEADYDGRLLQSAPAFQQRFSNHAN
ncbi:MAG: DUF3526 domain-containing protein [Congregibacter sp.]